VRRSVLRSAHRTVQARLVFTRRAFCFGCTPAGLHVPCAELSLRGCPSLRPLGQRPSGDGSLLRPFLRRPRQGDAARIISPLPVPRGRPGSFPRRCGTASVVESLSSNGSPRRIPSAAGVAHGFGHGLDESRRVQGRTGADLPFPGSRCRVRTPPRSPFSVCKQRFSKNGWPYADQSGRFTPLSRGLPISLMHR
jgi:hypothetical protein